MAETARSDDARCDVARSADNLVIVAPAVVADAPVSPRIALNVGLAAVIGLMAALGLAVLRETLDLTEPAFPRGMEELAMECSIIKVYRHTRSPLPQNQNRLNLCLAS